MKMTEILRIEHKNGKVCKSSKFLLAKVDSYLRIVSLAHNVDCIVEDGFYENFKKNKNLKLNYSEDNKEKQENIKTYGLFVRNMILKFNRNKQSLTK